MKPIDKLRARVALEIEEELHRTPRVVVISDERALSEENEKDRQRRQQLGAQIASDRAAAFVIFLAALAVLIGLGI